MWFYVGMTTDVNDRIKRHNIGREKATKPYKPFDLIYKKQFDTREAARDHEKYLKIHSNKEKLLRDLKFL